METEEVYKRNKPSVCIDITVCGPQNGAVVTCEKVRELKLLG